MKMKIIFWMEDIVDNAILKNVLIVWVLPSVKGAMRTGTIFSMSAGCVHLAVWQAALTASISQAVLYATKKQITFSAKEYVSYVIYLGVSTAQTLQLAQHATKQRIIFSAKEYVDNAT